MVTTIHTDVLSDGSEVFDVLLLEDDEVTVLATFNCVDNQAAIDLVGSLLNNTINVTKNVDIL